MDGALPIDYSPFSPGKPVPVEQFVGRSAELTRLARHVEAASKGRLQVAFLAGDRGIGKSSLATYIRSHAEQNCNMVGVHVFLGGAETLEEMTRRVFERVLRESNDKKWYQTIKSLFGKSVESADLFGLQLKFVPDAQQLDSLVRNFGYAVKNLIRELREAKKAIGLVLILDDINGLAASKQFADWLKSLIDSLATDSDPIALCLMIVGLDQRRQSLVELNPSLARAFDLFELEPWTEVETKTFFRESLKRHGVEFEEAAIRLMALYSGGRMKEIGVIVGDEDEAGVYRFASYVHHLYVYMINEKPKP